jgi:hypothetical protein
MTTWLKGARDAGTARGCIRVRISATADQPTILAPMIRKTQSTKKRMAVITMCLVVVLSS